MSQPASHVGGFAPVRSYVEKKSTNMTLHLRGIVRFFFLQTHTFRECVEKKEKKQRNVPIAWKANS